MTPVTSLPCVIHDPATQQRYDLSRLRRDHQNWVVYSNYSDAYIHFNFCDVLHGLSVAAEANCSSSGACLVKHNLLDGSIQSAESLGSATGPILNDPRFINHTTDTILFEFKTEKYMTVVFLLCDQVEDSRPDVFQVHHVTTIFITTSAACPISVTTEPLALDCAVELPSGLLVDLRSLRNAGERRGAYVVQTPDYEYLLNVCGPILEGCPLEGKNDTSAAAAVSSQAGGCQTERHAHGRSWSTGQYSHQLRSVGGGVIELVYDSGSPCRYHGFNRTTIILFFCDSHTSIYDSHPVFIGERDDCVYHFHWRTPLACPVKTECQVEIPAPTAYDVHHSATVDLTPLALEEGNHPAMASDVHTLSDFQINVCRPVNHVKGKPCSPGAGICMPAIWQPHPQNLGKSLSVFLQILGLGFCSINSICLFPSSSHPTGFPDGEPEWVETIAPTETTPAEGYVLLRYTNGTECSVGVGTRPLSSELRLTCSPDAGVGIPRLINDDRLRCHFVFEWATSVACPPDVERNERTCSVPFPEADYTFHLKTIPKGPQGIFHVESSLGLFTWNMCESVAQSNPTKETASSSKDPCADAGVCLEKPNGDRVSYGAASRMRLQKVGASRISMQYNGGSSCTSFWFSGDTKRYSTVYFSCNHHETRTIVRVVHDCFVIIDHASPHFCPPVTSQCFFSYNGTFYDLRLLASSGRHFWQYENDDAVYRLGICHDFGPEEGDCPGESAVCKLPKAATPSASWNFRGSAATQRLEMVRPGGDEVDFLQLTYFGPNKCANRSLNGGFYVTRIRFECGQHVGSPELVEESEDNCLLLFQWKSRVACAVEAKAVPLEDGFIRDSITESLLNLTQIIHPDNSKPYAVHEKRGQVVYWPMHLRS